MTTTKEICNAVRNVLDYLVAAELALYANEVAETRNGSTTRVSFHSHRPEQPFLASRGHPTVDQYFAWVSAGAYSAILYDGSLLQITYLLEGQRVTRHRLAYIPCPFDVDAELLASGEALIEVVELYRDEEALMRTPLRFDFDSAGARPGHPAAHLTINGSDCRIPCAAPTHVLRFIDFVFRHFYTDLWHAHRPFFDVAAWRHLGQPSLIDTDRFTQHLTWDIHATLGQVGGPGAWDRPG